MHSRLYDMYIQDIWHRGGEPDLDYMHLLMIRGYLEVYCELCEAMQSCRSQSG